MQKLYPSKLIQRMTSTILVICIVITLMPLQSFQAEAISSTVKFNSNKSTGTINIDGVADETQWTNQQPIVLNSDDSSTAVGFRTAWDADNFYIAVDVADNEIVNGTDAWSEDSIELYIDGTKNTDGSYGNNTAQYGFLWNDENKVFIGSSSKDKPIITDDIIHKAKLAEGNAGYTMEIKIPWKDIGNLSPVAGDKLGFTIHYNDKDAGKDSNAILFTEQSSAGNDWQNASKWAEMALLGAHSAVDDINLKLTAPQNIIEKGNTLQATVSATKLADGSNIDISGLTTKYESADTKIATVDISSGLITPVGVGKTDIMATVSDSNGAKTVSMSIAVIGKNIIESSRGNEAGFEYGDSNVGYGFGESKSALHLGGIWALGYLPNDHMKPVPDTANKHSGNRSLSFMSDPKSSNTQVSQLEPLSRFPIDSTKIYEISGWYTLKNNKSNAALALRPYYYAGSTPVLNSVFSLMRNYSGEIQNWTQFKLPIYAPMESGIDSLNLKYIFGDDNLKGENATTIYNLDDVAINEVTFDSLNVSFKSGKNTLLSGETNILVPDAKSNTGNQILISADSKNGIPKLADGKTDAITCVSSDPEVAKVDISYGGTSDGSLVCTITALKAGTTTLTYTANLGGISKSASIDLTVEGDSLATVTAIPAKSPINVGEKTTLTVSAKTASGKNVDMAKATKKFESSESKVATVDAETGEITGVGAGTATITVTVTSEGVTKSTPVNIAVLDTSPLESVSFVSPKTSLGFGEVYTPVISGKLVNGNTAILNGATYKYTSSNSEVASVDETTGVITAKNTAGTTDISVSVTLNNVTKTDKYTLTVSNQLQTYIYDFGKCLDEPIKTNYSNTNNTWAFVNTDDPGEISKTGWGGMKLESTTNHYLTLKINVPSAGYYTTSINHFAAGGGGIIRAYLTTAADDQNTMAAANSIGTFNCYDSSQWGATKDATLRSVYFAKPGEYKLTFKAIDRPSGSWGGSIYLIQFKMKQVGTADANGTEVLPLDIGCEPERTTIGVGETSDLIPNLTFKNGYVEDFTSATVTAEATDSNIAKVDYFDTTSSNLVPYLGSVKIPSVKITGVAVGSCVIKVHVTISGVTYTQEIPYEVKTDIAPQPIHVNFRQNISALNATIDKNGYVLDKSSSDSKIINSATFDYSTSSTRINASSADGEKQISFNFNVNMGGAFSPTFVGGASQFGGIANIYVDNMYIGTYDFFNSSSSGSSNGFIKESTKVTLKSINLTKGLHKITFVAVGANNDSEDKNNRRMYLGNFDLTGLTSLPTITSLLTTLDKENVAVGESSRIIYAATLSDNYIDSMLLPLNGTDTSYTKTVTYDSSIIAIDDNDVIKGLKPGTTKIKTSVTVNGTTKSYENTITVNSNTYDKPIFTLEKSELFNGLTTDSTVEVLLTGGSKIDARDYTVSYTSSDNNVATVDAKGVITAVAQGSATITANVIFNGISKSVATDIKVKTAYIKEVTLTTDKINLGLFNDSTQLKVSAKLDNNFDVDMSKATVTYTSSNPSVAAVNEKGLVLSIGAGAAVITAAVTLDGVEKLGSINIRVGPVETTSRSYYTDEKVANARENIKKYSWARETKDNAVKIADLVVGKEELLWNMVPGQTLPRSLTVGFVNDPDTYTCPYCGKDYSREFGPYGFLSDPLNSPWKIKCPYCRRKFPSNDFGKYYNTGLDENGIFDPAKADKTLLKNELYPEKGEGWGVDDGFGWNTGKTYINNKTEMPSVRTFISYYLHWGLYWKYAGNPGFIQDTLNNLRDAYLYTGDIRYGRTGAILLDRIADLYPSYDIYNLSVPNDEAHCWKGKPWDGHWYFNTTGGYYTGKFIGSIHETDCATDFAKNVDAFKTAMNDPQVIDFLSKKAIQYKLSNPKNTGAAIRQNSEDNILKEIFKAEQVGQLNGNFGMNQEALALAAVALDSHPETDQMLDYNFQSGDVSSDGRRITGGNIINQFVKYFDIDGFGNEVSPGYNKLWCESFIGVAKALDGYKGYTKFDIWKNPKWKQSFEAYSNLVLCNRYTPSLGDSGSFAGVGVSGNISLALLGYNKYRSDRLAQFIYLLNHNSTDGLKLDIFTKDPEKIADDINDVIKEKGTLPNVSDNLTGYGLAMFKDGNNYRGSNLMDTSSSFWMYYGSNSGHGHLDPLDVGIIAYGLDLSPDNGYPKQTGDDPCRMMWTQNTIAHNTVVVNQKGAKAPYMVSGKPLHFDDSGRVKVMDSEKSSAYSETSIYRRSVVSVKYDDNVSYYIDFFRVKGGDDHIYSFHAQADQMPELNSELSKAMTQQKDANGNWIGTYDGPDSEFGPRAKDTPQYLSGFTWLEHINKAQNPEGNIFVDWTINDFRSVFPGRTGLHLRLTSLNDYNLSEVTIADGYAPDTSNNPKEPIKYLLMRRKGANLDTLFTTALEPYMKERYIQSLTPVKMTPVSGTVGQDDVYKAVKVTLVGGRVDYIMYSTNNRILYNVIDESNNININFRGFTGVHTLVSTADGLKPTYSYVSDGDTIGEKTQLTGSFNGKIVDFTKELNEQNSITVKLDQNLNETQLKDLVGKYIYVSNDGEKNANYKIIGATLAEDGNVVLDIGSKTLVRAFVNEKDIFGGYTYNISKGQSFRIPVSNIVDNSPIITQIDDQIAFTGADLKFTIRAKSQLDLPLTYSAISLPRGAQFNADTQTFLWSPSRGQLGTFYAIFSVSDGGLPSTMTVKIKTISGDGGGHNTDSDRITTLLETKDVTPIVTMDNTTKLVNSTINTAELTKALTDAKIAVITIPPLNTAKGYQQYLPVEMLNKSSDNGKIKINTSVGNVTLPTSMFSNNSSMTGKSGDTVGITIKPVDTKTLSADMQTRIGNKPVIELSVTYKGASIAFDNVTALVTVNIPYTATAEEKANPSTIVVLYIDKSGKATTVPNSTYNSTTGMVTFTTTHFSMYAIANVAPIPVVKTFDDLRGYDWAKTEIEALATKGIINGTSTTTYSPGTNITRADFVTLLVRALGLKTDVTENFSDVNSSDYYYEALGIAKKLGIITGVGNNKYNPKAAIRRQDMMVITARALRTVNYGLTVSTVEELSGYNDIAKISGYAGNDVATLIKSGIITGSGNNVNPLGNTTRAEVAVMLYRIITKK